VGPAPWGQSSADGIWRFNGRQFEALQRGEVRDLGGLPRPLMSLCDFYQGLPDLEAVHVLAFGVKH
jgi:hypothetical protein